MKTFGAFKAGILIAYNVSKSSCNTLKALGFTIKELNEPELKDLLYRQWEMRRSIQFLSVKLSI